MDIEIYKKGNYQVLRVKDDIGLNTDLEELRTVIERQIAQGVSRIAIAFTQQSYLYTRSIAVLISCSEIIKDAGGHLAIIEPNSDITDILSVIDFDKMIGMYASESALTAPPS